MQNIIRKEPSISQITDLQNQINALAGDITTGLQVQIDAINVEQDQQNTEIANHETRITALENQDYPESLRNLVDVQVTLGPLEDQKVLYYDATADKFGLKAEGQGIADVADSQDYVRNLGAWKLLTDTTEIQTINTDLDTAFLSIANIQTEQTTQNNRLATIEAEQITQNGAINSNTTNLSNLQTQVNNLALPDLTDVSDSMAPTIGQLFGYNGTTWDAVNPPNTFPEAPTDGQNYL